ncbi:class I SAM-dependent methyltransferase [Rhodocaloribacter sp.]
MIHPKTKSTHADVAAHYDALDGFYRELWGEHLHHGLWETGRETPEAAVRKLAGRVAVEARITPGDAVCDVGCGYGATARMLARDYGAHVTGLTLSEAQVVYARAHTDGDNPVFLRRDWLANGLPGESFDAVVAIESLAHMTDKPAFFAEAHRVLRPGGRLVVCAWTADDDARPWHVRHFLEPICREGRLPSLGSAGEYAALCTRAGFADVAREDLSRRVARTWTVCLRRVAWGLLTKPRYARYLLDARHTERVFLRALPRLRLAFATGAFRYVLLTAKKPA